jgi:hypothetical protein
MQSEPKINLHAGGKKRLIHGRGRENYNDEAFSFDVPLPLK